MPLTFTHSHSSHPHTLTVIAMASGMDLNRLVFVGLMGMWDPPRQGVEMAILRLRESGVSVKLITGDARETAEAIGKKGVCQHGAQCLRGVLVCVALRLGVWSEGNLSLSGEQLDNLAPHETGDTILQVSELQCSPTCWRVTVCVSVCPGICVLPSDSQTQSDHCQGTQPTHAETKY